jgi:hypothetical protein
MLQPFSDDDEKKLREVLSHFAGTVHKAQGEQVKWISGVAYKMPPRWLWRTGETESYTLKMNASFSGKYQEFWAANPAYIN